MKPLVDVVPKYVNEAKPGKKYGSIKFDDGGKYLVPAAMVKQLKENVPAKVEIDEQDWKDGPVTIVTKVVGDNGAQPAKQFTKARMDPADAKGAFVTVILQAFIRAGKVSLNRDAIRIAREEIGAGYDMTLTTQQRDDGMDDEITI